MVLLDCPPNISTLSENIFRSADAILVPVIPTTLSERTFEQLLEFFAEQGVEAAAEVLTLVFRHQAEIRRSLWMTSPARLR